MLSLLHIRGLALIDDLQLEFSPGMNVLTGETGAGKSMIVDSLALLRGSRGRADLVRNGANEARVDALFRVSEATRNSVASILSNSDIEWGEDDLLLTRIIHRQGRSRSLILSTLASQGVLEKVGEQLIDICSQHEFHSLTDVQRHLEVLDSFAGLTEKVETYQQGYQQWRVAQKAREDLQKTRDEGQMRSEFLQFQLAEIERIDPKVDEVDELHSRRNLLRDGQRWATFARHAHQVLYESDEAIAGRLANLVDEAKRGPGGSSILAELAEQLTTAQIACEEAANAASQFADEINLEPGELEAIEERLHQLERLQRRHRCSINELVKLAESMRAELSSIDQAEHHLMALEAREQELYQVCLQRAAELHQHRQTAAKTLQSAVEAELTALHMPHACLQARVEQVVDQEKKPVLGPAGSDRVEFLFTANPGEPIAPLRKVASGGELSRVLLALKGVLSTGDYVATYVFDEVDAGVGGAVAEAIGRRLYEAARGHQVVCITHLPQIAAFADAHFRVDKQSRGGRTTTQVQLLTEDERVEEIARMLGGARITESARQHAQQLIQEARNAAKIRSRKSGKNRKGSSVQVSRTQ